MTRSKKRSGEQDQRQDMMQLGKIMRPHGIRGEVRMQIFTAHPERIPHLETVILSPERRPKQQTTYTLLNARFHRNLALLTLEGIDDRDAADPLRGMIVSVPLSEGAPLEDDEYYTIELIGMDVYTETDDYIGQLVKIFETGANDVFVVDGEPYGEVLLPDIEDVIRNIDLDERRITIHPLPGLLPDLDDDNDDTST